MTINAIGCGFDPHSRKYLFKFIFLFFALVSKQSATLSFASPHAMPSVGGKWGTECLNSRLPLPTLLCAEYSVKLILILI